MLVAGLELLSAQSAPQDASCLPALKVSDIEPTIAPTPVEISSAGAYGRGHTGERENITPGVLETATSPRAHTAN